MDPVSTANAREDMASVSDLLAEFAEWLDRQRGLAPVTIHNYCWHAELARRQRRSSHAVDAGAWPAAWYRRDRAGRRSAGGC